MYSKSMILGVQLGQVCTKSNANHTNDFFGISR